MVKEQCWNDTEHIKTQMIIFTNQRKGAFTANKVSITKYGTTNIVSQIGV
jgi:hypothetical protein